MAIIDILDPTNPGIPIYEDTTGNALGIFVSGYYVYLADGFSGLATIQVRKNVDKIAPIISVAPNDLTVEAEYSEIKLSWTVTDENPNTYTLELIGTGTIITSTAWVDNVPVVYDIPDGFALGAYTYNITFMDDNGNFISDAVTVTITGAISIGNFFLIVIGFSVIWLILSKKKQILPEYKN